MGKVLKYTKKTETGMALVEFRLTDDEASQIMEVVTSARRPVQIDFRGNLLRTAAIEIFDESNQLTAQAFMGKVELNDPAQRDEVIAFEEKLQLHRAYASREHDLEWYGHPFKTDRGDGWVLNPALGGVHWSTVQYAINQRAIRKHENGTWVILSEKSDKRHGGRIETKVYNEIKRMIAGLNELESRRRFARRSETGGIDTMVPMGG